MVKKYIPDRGDIVLINFSPQFGREQYGKRPAVVISPKSYNAKVGLAIFCPITSKIKNYPFEVILENYLKTRGAVLSDHVKSFDWTARNVYFKEKMSQKNLNEVLAKLSMLIS